MGLDDIRQYIIGIIAFTVIIGAGIYITGSFFASDVSLDSSGELSRFNSSLYRATEVAASVDDLDSSIEDVDQGVLGWLNALLGSVFNGLKVIGQSLGFMGTVSSEAGQIFKSS